MWVYIIYSRTIDRFYIGISRDPTERIQKHNSQAFGPNHWTAQTDDWEFFHLIKCKDSLHALRIEKHIKKMKSRKYLVNLKRYPEMESKLLTRYGS